VRSLASNAPALADEIDRFAQYHPTTLSLQKFIDFGAFFLIILCVCSRCSNSDDTNKNDTTSGKSGPKDQVALQ